MAEYRKRPVVIQAEQFIEGVGVRLPFVVGSRRGPMRREAGHWYIETLEGAMRVSNGDWIIKGVKGEFYPCKPEIFAMTYEPVEKAKGGA